MDLSRAVLVPKATKVEHDMQRLGLTRQKLVDYYREENADVIFASHARQLEMRRRVQELLPEARIVRRDEASREALTGAGLVIALGGDNHFIYLCHFLDSIPILGINADRMRSHGGLLSVTDENLEEVVRRLREGEESIEPWPRIQAFVDGRPAGTAVSEHFVGERLRKDMTRHVLRKNGGPEEEQKCSGLLIATGAGSTGWYGFYGEAFGRTEMAARWIMTEPFPRDHRYRLSRGEIRPGDALMVRSRNDGAPVVMADGLEETPFPYGSVATFRLSESPLRVIR